MGSNPTLHATRLRLRFPNLEDHTLTQTEQTEQQPPQTSLLVTYTLDPHKFDKYLPRLMNGELGNIEKYLPNIFAIGSGFSGTMEREKYDYRSSQYKIKQRVQFYSYLNKIIYGIDTRKKIEQTYQEKMLQIQNQANQTKQNYQQELEKNKQELLYILATLKQVIDQHHEKNKTSTY